MEEALDRQALEENQLGYLVKIFNLKIKIVKEKKIFRKTAWKKRQGPGEDLCLHTSYR